MITIGVISDTHGILNPKVTKLFSGVDHILHAGDIGTYSVMRDLMKIAPVTAVLGNCDSGDDLKEIEVISLGGFKIILRHIFDPTEPTAGMGDLVRREKPNVIVFGHTHEPFNQRWGEVLLFNPGVAGGRGYKTHRRVGILRCDETGVQGTHLDL